MLREDIKDNTEWLIIVDLDEFMYASDPNFTLNQEIQTYRKRCMCTCTVDKFRIERTYFSTSKRSEAFHEEGTIH